MKAALTTSQVIKDKLALKQLKLLAVYTDTDLVLWRKHLPELPGQWIGGRDEGEYLYKNNVYDLKALPTVYLLDKNKKVVLKDCQSMSLIGQNLLSKD